MYKHSDIRLWGVGNVLFGVINHASLSSSVMDESVLTRYPENATSLTPVDFREGGILD